MQLILKVLSYKGLPLPNQLSAEFTTQGGSIGRHADNTLVLADVEKIVSGRHASIVYENGQFWINDTSANGTYLINAAQNLEKQQAALQNHEILRIGEYEILVEQPGTLSTTSEINFDGPFASPAFFEPFDSGNKLEVSEQRFNLDQSSLDQSPLHDSFFVPPVVPSGDEQQNIANLLKGLDSLALPNEQSPVTNAMPYNPDPFSAVSSGFESGAAAISSAPAFANREMPKPQPAFQDTAAGREIPSKNPETYTHSNAQLMQLFLEGAGIREHGFLPPEQWAEVMKTTGALFRNMVEGLMDVLRARAEMKSEFRVSMTTLRSMDNNPLKFNPDIDSVLKLLLAPHNPAYIQSSEAVNEAFKDLKYHQIAITAGIQAAVSELIHKFDPESFESAYAEGVVFQKKAKCWELYCEKYPEIKSMAMEDFFGNEFAMAYERQMHLFGRN